MSMWLDTRTDGERTTTEESRTRFDVIDPTTGEVVDPTDPDALVDAYDRIDKRCKVFNEARRRIAAAIAELTEGPKKTRRVRGQRRVAKVAMPDDYWNQSILKEAWHAYPDLRDEFLAIERIRVKKREWKKAEGTSGPKDFETFKGMVAQANVGPSGAPRVSIER